MSKRSTHYRRRGSRRSEDGPSAMWDNAFDDFDEGDDVGEEWAGELSDGLDDDLGSLDVDRFGDEWLDGDWSDYQGDDDELGIDARAKIPDGITRDRE